jgi:hypothetical protein
MTTTEETVDLLDPSNSSKNTLKLENVCTNTSTSGLFADKQARRKIETL